MALLRVATDRAGVAEDPSSKTQSKPCHTKVYTKVRNGSIPRKEGYSLDESPRPTQVSGDGHGARGGGVSLYSPPPLHRRSHDTFIAQSLYSGCPPFHHLLTFFIALIFYFDLSVVGPSSSHLPSPKHSGSSMDCCGGHDPSSTTPPQTGTTIVAVTYSGGVVIGADSRVSTGNYISNRASDKITPLTDKVYLLRSGSASDTQAVSDHGEDADLACLGLLAPVAPPLSTHPSSPLQCATTPSSTSHSCNDPPWSRPWLV